MNIRIGTVAYWGWIAVTAATLGCQADNRVGIEPDGGANPNQNPSQNGGAGSGGGVSGPSANGSIQYIALAYASGLGRITVASPGGITRFDQATGGKIQTVNPSKDGIMRMRDATSEIAVSLLANLLILDADMQLERTIKQDGQAISLELGPDGDVVYTGGVNGKVHRFDTKTGAEISPALGPDSTDFIRDLAASPDGLYVAAAERDGVHVWRTADGAPVVQLPTMMGAQFLRFAPSSRELAVGDPYGTATYSMPDGTLIRHYGSGPGSYMAYSFDGTKLAVPAINDSVVKVFDTSTGAELVTLFDSTLNPNEEFLMHRVVGLTFVETNTHVAVAWGSGRLSKWSVPDGTLLWSRFDTDKP